MKRLLVLASAALCLGFCAEPALAASAVALFDEGHGQRFLANGSGELDLARLAGALRDAGFDVRTSRDPLDAPKLHGVGALVISGPFAPFSTTEISAIGGFLRAGGRLVLMLHIGQPAQGLLEQMGIQYSRGPIHESEEVIGGRGTDFAVTRFEPHALTDGLRSLSVFGCWALRNFSPAGKVIARTGPRAWLDSDGDGRHTPGEPLGSEGVVVAGSLGSGSYLVFGDDAIFQNRYFESYNGDPGRRLASWLAGAPAARLVPKPPRRTGLTDL